MVGGCLVAISVLAWWYLFRMASAMPQAQAWTAADLALLFVMWAVMMVAMMTPAAAPVILAFATVNRRRSGAGRRAVSANVFLLGYVVVWTAFSVIATTAQWWLHEAAVLSAAMALTSPTWSGTVLLGTGLFQWAPLKHSCLSHCRSPLSFLMSGWREGTWGAFNMGLRHGVYSVGCCWSLMAVLFVVGVMSLPWVIGLTALVMIEKIAPFGHLVGRVAGVGLALAGVFLLLGA